MMRARRVLFALALAALVGYLLLYVGYTVSLLRFPFDYDQGEGFELYDTLLFSRGEWPYRENETFPFYASNYPPLFHVIAAPLVRLFGPQYWIGRGLGFVGTLINAALIAYAVHRDGGGNRLVSALAGLAFLASNTVYHIGPLYRQHMFMVMLETLAVVLAAGFARRWEGQAASPRRMRWREMAALVAVLLAAGYTKQLAVVTCAAVFAFLFIRGPVRALVWGVIFALLGGAIFVWIDLSTGGQWWINAIEANVNLYMPGQAFALYGVWFRLHGPLIVAAVLLVLYQVYLGRISVYAVWFAAAAAGGLLSGKWGAGDSYFATAIAATCIISGFFAARLLRGDWANRGWVGLLVPAMYLIYAAAVLHMPTEGPVFGPLSDALGLSPTGRYPFYDSAGWVLGYAAVGHPPTEEDIAAGWQIVDYFERTDKPVMSEEAGFSLAAGEPVITNPTQLKNLFDNGLFDPTELVEMIDAQAFGYIIYRAQFYPPPVLDAVARAYVPVEVIPMNGFEYIILAPRDESTD